jgi:endonuclease III
MRMHAERKMNAGKARIQKIVKSLKSAYPQAQCALAHRSPLELLIATILSAQCTDVQVNLVTPALFQQYRTAADFAKAPQAALEKAVHSTGFFRNKAKNIQQACRRIVKNFHGQVPTSMDDLLSLPGVARKTANVVLGTAFGVASGIVVDTHVFRLSQRLGLSQATTPEKVEADLMQLLPQKEWIDFSHRLILHGRRICAARKPLCRECPLASLCPQIGVEPP